MESAIWTTAGPAILAAFLASTVEVVEAFTVVLAVATIRSWRPASLGTVAALLLLAVIVLALGPVLDRVPLHLLQLVIGILLLLFGMRWLRKAILRASGYVAIHDEDLAFSKETAELQAVARQHSQHLDWLAGIVTFKAVVLEGLEVVFIVIAVGAGRGLIGAASLGAFAAFVLVLIIGLLVHKPLSRVPENTLKFGVGVMLSAFGVFWTGEGMGVAWPAGDLMLPVFVLIFLAVGLSLASVLRRPAAGGTK